MLRVCKVLSRGVLELGLRVCKVLSPGVLGLGLRVVQISSVQCLFFGFRAFRKRGTFSPETLKPLLPVALMRRLSGVSQTPGRIQKVDPLRGVPIKYP